MRRSVALLAFAALTSSQLVALRCDMGAPEHQAAAAHEAAPHDAAPAHAAAAHGEAAPAHETAGHGQSAPGHEPPHHPDGDTCLMMMACGAASIRAVRTVAVARIPTPFVRADFLATTIPVAADLAVETPPPRLTV